jgi:flagellar protein FliL
MSDDDVEEDVDEGEVDGSEEEGGGRRISGAKIALFAGLPLLLIIGGIAGAFFTGLLDPLLGDESATEDADSSPLATNILFYDLPEMLVNLNTGGKQTNYLKIKVSLEVESEAMLAQLEALLPRVVDNFQVYLRELRVEDLNGSAGLYRLKEELLVRVNTAIKPHKVNDVLFREMLVQ